MCRITFPRVSEAFARVVLAGILLVCGSGALAIADRDGDGVGDDLEEILGMDPARPDRFMELKTRLPPAGFRDPGRYVTAVHLANAGGDRFVWRLTFAAEYPAARSIVQLYVDTDNNPETGRRGHGCEFMLKLSRGGAGIAAFAPDGTGSLPPAQPAVAVDGAQAYIAFDTGLAQKDGRSVFRLQVLSERLDPHSGADVIPYFATTGPALSDLAKIQRPADATENMGVAQTFGPRRIDPLLRNPANVRIPIRSCELDGFTIRGSEYRADNAVRTGGGARIKATCPVSGTFFPGFVLHDEAGREVIQLYLNGTRAGVAVADADDNDQHLFFLTEPISVRRGDVFELRASSAPGQYRIEDLVLLAEKPPAREPVYEFRHVAATTNRLTWISTWPAACTVDFGNGTRSTEPRAVANHRVLFPELREGQTQRYRITGNTPAGQVIDTGWLEHTWRVPPEPRTERRGRVALRIHAPAAAVPSPWPVTCGVPFPRGELGSDRHLRLIDADGRPVPIQTSTTSRWPDGSVRWILLDFRHRGAGRTYTLEYGPDIRRASPKSRVAPPPHFGSLELTDSAGGAHGVDLGGFEVVESGPLRTEWRTRGRIAGTAGQELFAYDVRLHSYPDTPWVRVQFSYGNCFSGEDFLSVRALRWILPDVKGEKTSLRQHIDDRFEKDGTVGTRFAAALGPLRIRDLWQNYPIDVSVGPEGSTIAFLPELDVREYAWAEGKMEQHRLFYWFDQGRYKLRQGMTKTQEVWIGLDGASPLLDRPLYAAPPPEWFRKTGVFGRFPVADPTKEILRTYDESLDRAMDGYLANRERNLEYGQFNFGDWWGERVINWGNLEYDTQHGFFLQFVRTGDFRFFAAAEEAELHNRDIDTVHHHRDPGRVGKVYAHCIGHVGDYYARSPLEGRNRGTARGGFSVSHTWCEGHVDHYFLTGDRRSLEVARMIADNYNSRYTTHYDFTNCRIAGWHLILAMAVYRATGDPFHLNACRIIVERVLERQTPDPESGVAGGGWRRLMVPGHCLCTPAHYGNAGFMVGVLLTGLRHYHQETGDPAVAEAIRRGAKYLIEDMWVPEVNGFRYTSCPKSSRGAWSNLLLFDGIGYAYGLQADPLLARTLMAGTDSGIRSVGGFGKSFSQMIRVAPHSLGVLQALRDNPPVPVARCRVRTPQPFDGSMEVAFDGSPSSVPAGQTAVLTWDFGDGAKATGISVVHRYARGGRRRTTLTVAANGLTDTTEITLNLPPSQLVMASRSRAVSVEAEAFSAQGKGKVKTPANRVNASGAIVTAWHADIGHWLEWTVEPPRPGPYHLVLKYATDGSDTRRSLLLNGTSPHPDCNSIPFPRTGGYSNRRDNWEYLIPGEKQPVVLQLRAGENRIRMTNLNDGLALDQLVFIPADLPR